MGLEIGAILELFHLSGVPAGGTRVPESGPASVVAVAVSISAGGPGGLALGLVAGLAVSEIGGRTINVHRHMTTVLLGRMEAGSVTASKLTAAHLTSVLLDFVRGVVVTATGLVVGGWVAGVFVTRWPLPYQTTVALVLIGAAVHLGALLKGFGGWKSRRAVFLVGLVAGIVGASL